MRVKFKKGDMLISFESRVLNLYKKVIHQEYGSSETGTISINLTEDVEIACNSVGTPLSGVCVSISHSDVIKVKSLGAAEGYMNKPFPKTKWLDTGDLGYQDSNGFIYIEGRKKRLINLSGLKVNPSEIEDCLLGHSYIKDAYVTSGKDKDLGDFIKAYIVRENDALTREQVLEHCNSRLPLFKIPTSIIWMNSIPKTILGKTRFKN